MKSVIIIPARYESKRFPGKPLFDLDGKTMIQRVYENAVDAASDVEDCEVYIATDDEKIEQHINEIGAKCIMTSKDLNTGSDRVLEACSKLDYKPEIVMNLQGDTPFVTKDIIVPLIQELKNNKESQVTTSAVNLTWDQLDKFREHKKISPSSGTTVTLDNNSNAYWFSKNVIPNIRKEEELKVNSKYSPVFKHFGLYCYRLEVLEKFSKLEQSYYEKIEELEQLRFLENDINVKVIKITQDDMPSIAGIDTPQDAELAIKILKNEN